MCACVCACRCVCACVCLRVCVSECTCVCVRVQSYALFARVFLPYSNGCLRVILRVRACACVCLRVHVPLRARESMHCVPIDAPQWRYLSEMQS